MQITTTPNKEAVRRICILNGVLRCHMYIPINTEKVIILIDIKNDQLDYIEKELQSWCGMPFKVVNSNHKNKETARILKHGIKLLPMN